MRPLLIASVLILAGCATAKADPNLAPLKLVDRLDLPAFMGDWHVLGNMPTATEEGCHNALEQYALQDDGTIAITFSCNKDSFDGKRDVKHFTATVENPGLNTEWRVKMKFAAEGSTSNPSEARSVVKRSRVRMTAPRVRSKCSVSSIAAVAPAIASRSSG